MEYAVGPEGRGADLKSGLRRGPLAVQQALHFAIQFCRGMEHAQQRVPGLVHRDIKPENILTTPDKTLKVTRFGPVRTVEEAGEAVIPELPRARAVTDRAELIRTDTVMGTPPYMSPEH